MWNRILNTRGFPANPVGMGIGFLISGAGIGGLIGLSVSPVIQSVVTGLLTVLVSAASIVSGLRGNGTETSPERREQPEPPHLFPLRLFPIATMVLGIALGASLGVYARTNQWFGPNLDKFVAKWEPHGLERKVIVQRLFDQVYPPAGSKGSPTGKSPQTAFEQKSSMARLIREMIESTRRVLKDESVDNASQPIKLGGLWAGNSVTEEDIQEARRELLDRLEGAF